MKKQVVVGVATAVVLGLVGVVAFVVSPRIERKARETKAMDNLRSLSLMVASAGPAGPGALEGKRYVLWSVAAGKIDARLAKNLEVLYSPGDESRTAPASGERHRALTEESLRDPTADVSDLTSFAGRRRSADSRPTSPHGAPLLADLSFRDQGIVLVAFASGHTERLTREQLGLGPDDPIVAGPASRSPILRQLSEE